MKQAETYRYTPSEGQGMFFFTDCGNRMYSASNDPMRMHGRLCPKCFMQNRYVTLYLRGTKEANAVIEAEGSEE